MLKKIFILFFAIFYLFCCKPSFAIDTEEEIFEASVDKVLQGGDVQKLLLSVTKGTLKGQQISVEHETTSSVNKIIFEQGDKVMVSKTQDHEGNPFYQIADYSRRDALQFLFIVFILLTVVIAGKRGFTSLLGMGISFLVIFFFVLPQILAGYSPILIAILGSLLIIPVSFLLSHGFNQKTFVAIAGTLISLVITGVLATIFIEAAKLTGFASEEAGFLQVAGQGTINIKGLLLAGIIIGVLGVLDDITISQSAIVFQLKEANRNFNSKDLYKRAMNIGKDHISSMVNTLILVYTGASLPLLLLFVNNPYPFSQVINYEIIADEIVRTLVGSIGLVLAVPVTTLIAASLAVRKKAKSS
jgi:uncharacterized membrane protein